MGNPGSSDTGDNNRAPHLHKSPFFWLDDRTIGFVDDYVGLVSAVVVNILVMSGA